MVGRAHTVLTAAAAFLLLVVLWELAKLVLPADGVALGDTRVLPRTDDSAMPHAWTVLARLGEPEVVGAMVTRTDVELFHSLAAGWWTTLARLRLPAGTPSEKLDPPIPDGPPAATTSVAAAARTRRRRRACGRRPPR